MELITGIENDPGSRSGILWTSIHAIDVSNVKLRGGWHLLGKPNNYKEKTWETEYTLKRKAHHTNYTYSTTKV